MKTISTYILCLLLCFGVLSCSEDQKVPILDLVIMQDLDNAPANQLSFNHIDYLLDFDRFLEYEFQIRYRELSRQGGLGLLKQAHLPLSDSHFDTKTSRLHTANRFKQATEELFNPIEVPNRGDGERSKLIYPSLVYELNRLARASLATNKIIILSSNLFEDNEFFSVFREKDKSLLLEHPGDVLKYFDNQFPLEDLRGIRVYIFYQADEYSSRLFYEMSRLYTYLLSAHGAEVLISTQFVEPNFKPE